MAELCRRPWPGNARELRNTIEHGALMARGGAIGPECFPPVPIVEEALPDVSAELQAVVRNWAAVQLASASGGESLYQRFLAEAEPALLDTVLENTAHNRAAAADVLGIHRATLRKKLT